MCVCRVCMWISGGGNWKYLAMLMSRIFIIRISHFALQGDVKILCGFNEKRYQFLTRLPCI